MVIAAKRASFCGFYHARNINMSPNIYLIVRGNDMEASASRRGVEREGKLERDETGNGYEVHSTTNNSVRGKS
jgi:hypothetical protein